MSTDKYAQNDSKRGIVKSTTIMSSGTLASRILGFFRDVLIAHLLGTAAMAEAFFVAFRIPNLFRDLVGEGATNSALVPVLSEYEAKKDKEALWRFVSVFFILSLMILSAITVLGIIFAPLIVRVIAPGFIVDSEKLESTIRLTRIMFPYLILIGLTAYSMGILYTFRSFLSPALSPCLLNVAMIAGALISIKTHQDTIFCLAVSVLVGGVLQLLMQTGSLFRRGMVFYPPATLSHEGAKKVGRLLLPRLFGSAIYQLNILVDTLCASLAMIVGQGGIAAIYYANRIVQFPMGMVGVSLASAILPSLAGFAARNDTEHLKKTLMFSLENILLVMLPTSVFLVILAVPITRVIFERGEFNAYSTAVTSWALLFYALGLVGFGGAKIMVTTFHALQDTATPVRIGFLCLVVNVALNFLLMAPLKVGGIALASSIASTMNFLLLFRLVKRRLGKDGLGVNRFFLKVAAATAVMAFSVIGFWQLANIPSEAFRLIAANVLALLVFTASGYYLQIEQIKKAFEWISRKK